MSDLAAVAAECAAFVDGRRSLNLATAGDAGSPLASYAPFVRDDDGAFCVLLSELAPHTANLAVRPYASILLIEDEGTAREPFARLRAVLDCEVEAVARSDARRALAVERFRRRFGDIVDTLDALADFGLFRLSPREGTFVKGFGQAFRLRGAGLEVVEHTRPGRGRGG